MTFNCIFLAIFWRRQRIFFKCFLWNWTLLIQITAWSLVSSTNKPWLERLFQNFLLQLCSLAYIAFECFCLYLLYCLHRDSTSLFRSGMRLLLGWQIIDWSLGFLLYWFCTLLETLSATFEHTFVDIDVLRHRMSLLDINLVLSLQNRPLSWITWN